MGVFQPPALGARNLTRAPKLTIRLLTTYPQQLRNVSPPMLANELVGVFNGYDGTMRLFVVSGDGTALIPVAGA